MRCTSILFFELRITFVHTVTHIGKFACAPTYDASNKLACICYFQYSLILTHPLAPAAYHVAVHVHVGERVENKQVLVNKYMPTVTMSTLGQDASGQQQQPEFREVASTCV